jgi:hypothetical protein
MRMSLSSTSSRTFLIWPPAYDDYCARTPRWIPRPPVLVWHDGGPRFPAGRAFRSSEAAKTGSAAASDALLCNPTWT